MVCLWASFMNFQEDPRPTHCVLTSREATSYMRRCGSGALRITRHSAHTCGLFGDISPLGPLYRGLFSIRISRREPSSVLQHWRSALWSSSQELLSDPLIAGNLLPFSQHSWASAGFSCSLIEATHAEDCDRSAFSAFVLAGTILMLRSCNIRLSPRRYNMLVAVAGPRLLSSSS